MAIKSSPPVVEAPRRRYEPAQTVYERVDRGATAWIIDRAESSPGWRTIDFPLGGPRGGSRNETGDVVPSIRTTPPTPETTPFPTSTARGNQTPYPGVVPYVPTASSTMIAARDWFEYSLGGFLPPVQATRKADLRETIPTGTITDDGIVYGPTTVEEPNMSWIEDLYSAVDETIFGGGLPGGFIAGQNAPQTFVQPGAVLAGGGGVVVPPAGPPMAPPPGGGGACGPGSGGAPVFKSVCGVYKWVYPKRRRRKALATKGDLKDLAALKGILGGGKSFETWIATHS